MLMGCAQQDTHDEVIQEAHDEVIQDRDIDKDEPIEANSNDDDYLYISPENLAIVEVHDTSDRYYQYIQGTVYNLADSERTLIKIAFTTYDASDNIIGTRSDRLSVLESGQYWEFEVLVPKDGVESYSFAELSAYE